MRIRKIKSDFELFYSIFIKPPKKWRPPLKSAILIYDEQALSILAPYLSNFSFNSIALRGESINIHCLIKAMLKLKFWKLKPIEAYSEAYIEAVNPTLIITMTDNLKSFYELSKSFSNTKTIFIQNGTRGISGDIFDNLQKSDKYHVDYMLVFCSEIGKYYQKFLSGEAIFIGSFKNNAIKKMIYKDARDVLFISQFIERENNSDIWYYENDGTPVYWDLFFETEKIILNFLDKWCFENKKQLKICGRYKKEDTNEKDFFKKNLHNCEWVFIPRQEDGCSYKLVDSSEIVVHIDSTLGYESIARGKKTATFSCRFPLREIDKRFPFGWPKNFSSNGPFWTNNQDEKQFQRIMDYLNSTSILDWHNICQQYNSDLMEYDPGNGQFVELLGKLTQKLKR